MGNSNATTKWMKFSWTSLSLLSTAHKVINTGFLLQRTGYFESMINFLFRIAEIERERERGDFQIKSSTTCIKMEVFSYSITPAKMEISRAHDPSTTEIFKAPSDPKLLHFGSSFQLGLTI